MQTNIHIQQDRIITQKNIVMSLIQDFDAGTKSYLDTIDDVVLLFTEFDTYISEHGTEKFNVF